MASQDVVIQSPTSFIGATRRIWKLTRLGPPAAKIGLIPLAVILCAVAWVLCAVWLVAFGIVMVPWRLLRRGSRKRKQERMRHDELLAAARRP
jgi:uncharacterized membrane protein